MLQHDKAASLEHDGKVLLERIHTFKNMIGLLNIVIDLAG
jgi:hypothetical protein